jgi:hypothetical protein
VNEEEMQKSSNYGLMDVTDNERALGHLTLSDLRIERLEMDPANDAFRVLAKLARRKFLAGQ